MSKTTPNDLHTISREYIICTPGGALDNTLDYLVEVAKDDKASVLLIGPTGTGKERLADWLVKNSPRNDKPYEKINCAGLPETLIDSQLFGHKKGAFTGASGDRMGLIEGTRGGTLLLDELAVMPSQLQAKLLRVMESGKVLRLGDVQSKPVDVRFIAATSLDEEMHRKLIPDLLHRFDHALNIPPLCERSEDLPYLIRHFTEGTPFKAIELGVLFHLAYSELSGNVRELRNLIKKACIWHRVHSSKGHLDGEFGNIANILSHLFIETGSLSFFEKGFPPSSKILDRYYDLLRFTNFADIMMDMWPSVKKTKVPFSLNLPIREDCLLSLDLTEDFPQNVRWILETWSQMKDAEVWKRFEHILKNGSDEEIFPSLPTLGNIGNPGLGVKLTKDSLSSEVTRETVRSNKVVNLADFPRNKAMTAFERMYFEEFEAKNTRLTIGERAKKAGMATNNYRARVEKVTGHPPNKRPSTKHKTKLM